MGTTHNAQVLFRQLPAEIKVKVFEIATGKLVYFPSGTQKRPVDKVTVCEKYAKGESLGRIAESLGISRVRVWQILNYERLHYHKGRVNFWKNKGLSLRAIARLFNRSHETVR